MKTSIVEYEGDQLEIDFNCDRGTPSLSIPCLIKQPHRQQLTGWIVGDRGCSFDVKVEDGVQTVSKLYVFPHFPPPEKCRTDPEIRGLSSNCTENHAKAVFIVSYSFQPPKITK